VIIAESRAVVNRVVLACKAGTCYNTACRRGGKTIKGESEMKSHKRLLKKMAKVELFDIVDAY
jgi:hypothetical protein